MNKQQYGVTLVEMLLSLLLSTALIAGIGSLFVQMQKSNKIQNAYSNMMDDSRYVLEILQKEMRRTGSLRSRSDQFGIRNQIFVAANDLFGTTIDLAQGGAIQGDAAVNPANDSLVLRYQLNDEQDLGSGNSSNSSSPCTQNLTLDAADPLEDPATTEHVVTIYVYVNAGKLMCIAQRARGDLRNAVPIACVRNCVAPFASAELIGNVERLVVTYGIDSDADFSANYYVSASNVAVAPVNLWRQVVSAKLSLVLKSEEDRLTSGSVTYKIDETPFTPGGNRLYRVFGTSIAFRNLLY